MEPLWSISYKALHKPYVDDGIIREYEYKPPQYITNTMKRMSGVCPNCHRIGRISAPCKSCPPSLIYQMPVIRCPNLYRGFEGSFCPTTYRLDTLFYSLHMSLYDQNDPTSVTRGYTPPVDPLNLLVPLSEQGETTYAVFAGEPLPVIRYTHNTCDRSYPSVEHPRRQIIHSLMTDNIASLRVDGQYIPLLQTMIDEWKTASVIIQEHMNYISDFLDRNGTRLQRAVASIDDDDDDDDNKSRKVARRQE